VQGLHSRHEDWLNTTSGGGGQRAPQGLILPYDDVRKPHQCYAGVAGLSAFSGPGLPLLAPPVPEEIRGELHLIQPPDSVASAKGFLQVGRRRWLLAAGCWLEDGCATCRACMPRAAEQRTPHALHCRSVAWACGCAGADAPASLPGAGHPRAGAGLQPGL
jgi:hypothetical protein